MAVNLAVNVRNALEGFNVAEKIHCWLDSSVALHWLKDDAPYRQFVANRVSKMRSHENVLWRYVPTAENPADLGSRGGTVDGAKLWSHGPDWLSDESKWPTNIVTKPSELSEAEKRVLQEFDSVGVETKISLETVLEKYELRKTLLIFGWVARLILNCRNPSAKTDGPLTTVEVAKQELFWVKRTQQQAINSEKFLEDKEQLNLQTNENGIWECCGKIQGESPIYLPDFALFTTKVVQRAHVCTLHGGVGLVMAKVRETYWVPRLRKLARKVITECWGCKRSRTAPAKSPPPGLLPTTRTEKSTPFNIIGVDFAGPVKYRSQGKDRKSYIVLYSCSLTRAIMLDLLPNLETKEFLKSLKHMIARRGRPSLIYSDNGSTFVAAAKWLKSVRKDEELNALLRNHQISWRFHLNRAPWWGDQFERLIGLIKAAFYKTVGSGTLTWDELREVLLDIEITINNRPLCYMEEDEQFPTLTPNSMLFLNPNYLPELKPYHQEDGGLRKRAKFLRRVKGEMWRRWTDEYMRSLRERHRLKHKAQGIAIAVGDVVLIKSTERNRNHWPLGIVETLIVGKDGVVRAVRLRSGRDRLERAVQHLYPLELSCDIYKKKDGENKAESRKKLNPDAPRFTPKRHAAVKAEKRIHEQLNNEQQVD